jgi:uncharacterized protein (TIGR00270 family)
MCGKNTGDLFLIGIEGSKLQVCEMCARSGNMLGKVREAPRAREIIITKETPEIEIINNYGAIIHNRREALGLTLEDFAKKINESESTLRKIEAEKLQPNERTAEKLDHALKIKLYQMVKRENIENVEKKQNKALTLEDIAFIKKKQKD